MEGLSSNSLNIYSNSNSSSNNSSFSSINGSFSCFNNRRFRCSINQHRDAQSAKDMLRVKVCANILSLEDSPLATRSITYSFVSHTLSLFRIFLFLSEKTSDRGTIKVLNSGLQYFLPSVKIDQPETERRTLGMIWNPKEMCSVTCPFCFTSEPDKITVYCRSYSLMVMAEWCVHDCYECKQCTESRKMKTTWSSLDLTAITLLPEHVQMRYTYASHLNFKYLSARQQKGLVDNSQWHLWDQGIYTGKWTSS